MVRMQYSKQAMNLGIAFLNKEIPELLRVNLLLTPFYYPGFENIRGILEELQFLIALNKEHKKFFLRF